MLIALVVGREAKDSKIAYVHIYSYAVIKQTRCAWIPRLYVGRETMHHVRR